MVVIFSEEFDMPSNDVGQWLKYYEKDYLRINYNSSDEELNKKLKALKVKLLKQDISINNIGISNTSEISYWFRRPNMKKVIELLSNNKMPTDTFEFPDISSNVGGVDVVNNNIYNHHRIFYENVFNDFNTKKLGSPFITGLNKLKVLKLASGVGLKIPDTLVTSSGKKVAEFHAKHKAGIITKSLFEVIPLYFQKHEKYKMTFYTETIDNIKKIPKVFAPSLFQENILKEFEIRVFYTAGVFFSSAIFSQYNANTKKDFRADSSNSAVRIIPFLLPENLKVKIDKLMKLLTLDNGSIDLIKCTDGEYYFLEINPVGQYGFISAPCNFNIDKYIAEQLIEMTNEG